LLSTIDFADTVEAKKATYIVYGSPVELRWKEVQQAHILPLSDTKLYQDCPRIQKYIGQFRLPTAATKTEHGRHHPA